MVSRRLLAVAGALAVDRMAGEPPAAVHPVAGFGRAMQVVERLCYSPTVAGGVVYAALGIGLGGIGGVVVGSTLVATYVAVGGRALADAAGAVGDALDNGDLDRARALLPGLVGRDPEGLDEAELSRAVVESVAENTVDAVIAPALWAALAGAPGALGYRAINTMDAMVGNHSSRYRRFGTAAARLDDAANWVPARLTALLVALARPHRSLEVWRAVRADAPSHPSPNAGVAEAAFAAALGVRLGGRNRYGPIVENRPRLGAGPAAGREDIGPAVRLSRDCTAALAGLLLIGSLIVTGTPRRRRGHRP
jgi:adenosylcobinamide-phosphate synthase